MTFCFECLGQSEFLLIGGQEFKGKLHTMGKENVLVEYQNKRGKTKIRKFPKDRLYAITTNGHVEVVYDPDSSKEGFSKEDMLYYIYGNQDAAANHKTPIPIIVSAAVSGGLSVYLASENSVLLIISPIPAILLAGWSQGNDPKPDKARSAEVLKQPAYILGYQNKARSKKIFNSIKASLAAMIAGSLIGFSIHSQSEP